MRKYGPEQRRFRGPRSIGTPAIAAPVAEAPQVTVSYADLDLGSDGGVAMLNRRIHGAAIAVCPDDPGMANLSGQRLHERCVAETQQRAQPSVAALATAARASHAAKMVAR
ncbi:MAG: UrcA family protein [Novosphingobium sp.]|nr:UrcA family protein [Novosphingobium sp.]